MLKKREKKEDAKINSEAFKERFQFMMWINDSIICQRYFRIPMYNSDALVSKELYDILDECVNDIKNDLKYKSFLFMSIMENKPFKLCGFANGDINIEDLYKLTHEDIRGDVELSDGTTIFKSYIDPTDFEEDIYEDKVKPKEYEYTYKFAFIADDNVVYERIWDASQYPKFIRNSVDLSNTLTTRPIPTVLNSADNVSAYLKSGRKDLLYITINKIIDIASGKFDEPNAFTKKMKYGNKTYSYSTYDKEYVESYRKWTADKARKYRSEQYY